MKLTIEISAAELLAIHSELDAPKKKVQTDEFQKFAKDAKKDMSAHTVDDMIYAVFGDRH